MDEQRVDIENLVRWPGACMAAAAVFQIFTSIGLFALSASSGLEERLEQYVQSTSPGASIDYSFFEWSSPLNLTMNVVSLALHALIVVGGVSMMTQRRWGLAMTAAILSIFPCTSPCCCLGLPLGIWAVIVLVRPDVKAAMRASAAPASGG